jgi:hypothetical protein
VVDFIFADLLIAPRMALFLAGTFYATVVAAGYVVELLFGGLGLIPSPGARPDPRPGGVVGLHHLAEHHLPGSGGCPDRAIRPHRRGRYAADDGRLAR